MQYTMTLDNINPENSNTSGGGKNTTVPNEIKKWNWGAFLLSWIWAIAHKIWIGLIALLPFVIMGIIAPFTEKSDDAAGLFIITLGMMIILGIKGNEWAWQNNKWTSVEEFLSIQRKWNRIALLIIGIFFILGIILLF